MKTKTEEKPKKAELHVRVSEVVLSKVRHAIVDRHISLGEAVDEALEGWLDLSFRVDTKPQGGGR